MNHIDITPNPPADDADETAALASPCRRDGWTPFARRLFLQVLAETGRVSRACEYARLSPQSAYALRYRDVAFAAGWDAACHLARAPLADALQEMAADGVTETLRRDGEIVAERHRHDSRLSMAVLHRLDKRCDRAEDHGAYHLPLIPRWDEWLDLIGNGEDEAAQAMLDDPRLQIPPDYQLHQLPLGENPIARPDPEDDGSMYWKDGDGRWVTDFPPPAGFDGAEHGAWRSRDYRRDCTSQECDLLDRLDSLDQAEIRARADRRRDAAMASMIAELAERTALPPAPPSA